MKKLKSLIIIVIFVIILFGNSMLSYSAFYDLEYPPDSSKKADYTEEDANKQRIEKSTNNSVRYVGKSSNNYLKSLNIENATIEPLFNRQYVEYKCNLIETTNKRVKIIAEAEDEKAKVEGTGEIKLEDGANDIRVVVTAENGDVQIYNLHIELPQKQSDLKINSLSVYGISQNNGERKIEKIIPSFDARNYEYSLNVEYDITSLYIEADYEPETFILTKGIEYLDVGYNAVYISVIDKNKEEKSTIYKINVTRNENKKNKEQQILIIVILVLFVMILILTIYKLIYKKLKKC